MRLTSKHLMPTTTATKQSHAEGLAEPTHLVSDLDGFDSAEIRKIMRSNCLALTRRAA